MKKAFVFLMLMVMAHPFPGLLAAETPVGAGAAAALSPEGEKIKAYMEELFAASRKVNASGAEKASARLSIEKALDWDRVARDCLGAKQWKKQSPANLNDYVSLLKEVIVKTAYSRMDKFWQNTTYTFDKIEAKGNSGQVTAMFNVNGEPFALEYFLEKKGGRWLIHDISFEDLRYSTNINEQISAFLKEKPFSALLDRLKKRRDELNNPAKKS